MSELFDVVLLPIVLLLLIMFVLIVYFVYDNRTQLFNLNSSLHSYINEALTVFYSRAWCHPPTAEYARAR